MPDKNLYIEVKRFMAVLYTVNKLYYLLQLLPENFFIRQMIEDDWRKELVFYILILSKNRLESLCEIQFNEIFQLSNKQLHDLSYKRLSEYICTKQEEY